MQNLDEFKVRNFTKRVLRLQRDRQEDEIYAFTQQQQHNDAMAGGAQANDDLDEEESDGEEETKEEEKQQASAPKQEPVTAPMPGSDFSFEDEVENALQRYVQANNAANMLMPTINGQASSLKEGEFKQWVRQEDGIYKQLYEKDQLREQSQVSESNRMAVPRDFTGNIEERKSQDAGSNQERSRKRLSDPLQASLMLVPGSYDNRYEKLELVERKKRKVYRDQESGYDLQDLYGMNETLQVAQERANNPNAFGRATHMDVMQQSKLRVYLYPRVYPQRDLEATMMHISDSKNLSCIKDYLKSLINFFKSNPYAAAKLFHGIATDAFHYRQEEPRGGDQDEIFDSWTAYYGSAAETNTKVEWGTFLPDRVRQMLLNMSRYFFDNILAADSLNPNIANEKFFTAFKIFVQHCTAEELCASTAPLKLHWHFAQVIKVLYEGQTRNWQCNETLRKIFQPVYERIGVSALRKQLTRVTETTNKFLKSPEYLQDGVEPASVVDQLRSKLFDQNPSYSFSFDSIYQRQNSEDISGFDQLISSPPVGRHSSSMGNGGRLSFHDSKMPAKIGKDMLRLLSRVMPQPVLDYEKALLEPLTAVFADYQAAYNAQDFANNLSLKKLPDCNEFTFEVVNTNMLMADLYAPKNIMAFQYTQTEEVEQFRPENGAAQFKQLMTDKLIEICTQIMDSFYKLHSDVPFRLRFMIRLLLDKQSQEPLTTIGETSAPLIAEFLAGCWLSNAFRWPEMIGMEPSFKEEALTLGHLLTACRLVIETALSCEELPFPSNGHRTYDITALNAFIRGQKSKVLALYNNLFISVDVGLIREPSFSEMRNENPTKPTAPREIFEASLMCFSDLAVLVKLVQWQFQQHWKVMQEFEINIDFRDGGDLMLKKNTPEVLKQRISRAKSSNKKKSWAVTNALAFWVQEKIDEYEQIYSQLFKPFSFDLQWPFINYNYQAIYLDDPALVEFLLSNKGNNLQSPLFKVYRQLDQVAGRQALQFRDEIFEEQFLTLYNYQKFESFKNQIKADKQSSQKEQLLTFVNQFFDPYSNHEQLREKPGRIFGSSRNQPMLPQIDEMSEASFLNDTTVDNMSEYDEDEKESNADDSPANATTGAAATMINTNTMSQSHQAAASSQNLMEDANANDRRNLPNSQDAPSQTMQPNATVPDRYQHIKDQYVDAISRVFYHLRGALDEPNFLTERINQRIQIARGVADGDYAGDVSGDSPEDFTLNLEDLFKNVLEDDRNQPDQSMKLQLDAFLIKRYFSKLDPLMRVNLMQLLKQRLNFVTKMMDLNFERQNYKYDRVLKFISYLKTISNNRLALFDRIYASLKVNRFINRSWGTTITTSRDDINEMIRQVYLDEAQSLRSLHHQTEILGQQMPVNMARVSLEAGQNSNSFSAFRQNSQPLVSVRSSVVSATDFIDELRQVTQIEDMHRTRSIREQSVAQRHATENRSIISERAESVGSFFMAERQVTIDINIISSNLIYVATVLNFEYVKKQIKEVDLESMFILSSIVDMSDDYFLIYDLYKIYLSCVKRVLIGHQPQVITASDRSQTSRHEEFLNKVKDVFFQQLIQRIWDQLKQDPEMLERDAAILEHFRTNFAEQQQNPIERDMSMLDLSSSSDENSDDEDAVAGEEKTDDKDIYGTAIDTLLTLNKTNDLDKKAGIIERSVLIAIRAYKQSNLLSNPSKQVSPEALNRILEHVVSECYLRDETFTLHLNLAFVLMILMKRAASPNSIQSVAKYVGNLCKTMDENARASTMSSRDPSGSNQSSTQATTDAASTAPEETKQAP